MKFTKPIETIRALLPGSRLLSNLDIAHASEIGPGMAANYKFLTTVDSSALNLSQSGFQRVNLNESVETAAPDDPVAPITIRRSMNRVIATIKAGAPDFGQRFYRTGTDLNSSDVSADHADIYLQKVAANIQDYIDEDNQPTIVRGTDNTILINTRPERAIQPNGLFGTSGDNIFAGENPVVAIGKENIPYLSEYVLKAWLKNIDPWTPGAATPPATEARFELYYDYYLEFWNMGTKDLSVANGDLGSNPFIRIYNQAPIDTGSGGTFIPGEAPRDFDIPLSKIPNLVFKAGEMTIITTDLASSTTTGWGSLPNLYEAPVLYRAGTTSVFNVGVYPENVRYYEGVTRNMEDGGGNFRVQIKGNTGDRDFNTKARLVMGNDFGVIDSALGLLISRPGKKLPLSINWDKIDRDPSRADPSLNFYRGGHVDNTPLGASAINISYGDPRAKNEPLFFNLQGGSPEARHGLEHTDLNNSEGSFAKGSSSLGAFNIGMETETLWPDYSEKQSVASAAPMFIANKELELIGELGNIYDPARDPAERNFVQESVGGGLTFKIGQPDPRWDKAQDSRSRTWAAWRLVDIFDTTSDLEITGPINPNGYLRDNGMAFMSAVIGLQFLAAPNSDRKTAGKAISAAGQNKLKSSLSNRLGQSVPNPFFERGEISELLELTQATTSLAAGATWDKVNDRGREELVRRLLQLITTKGNTYRIYVVGQSMKGDKVLGTSSHIALVTLEPQFTNPPNDTFDPADANAVAERFAPVARYTISHRFLQ